MLATGVRSRQVWAAPIAKESMQCGLGADAVYIDAKDCKNYKLEALQDFSDDDKQSS